MIRRRHSRHCAHEHARAMRFFSDNAAAACPQVMEALAEANRLDTAYDGDAWSQRLDGAFSDLFGTRGARPVGDHRDRRQLPRPRRAVPAARRDPVPRARAYRAGRGRRARLLHRRRQADAAAGRGRQGHAGGGRGGLRAGPLRRPPGPARRAVDHQCHRIWPDLSRPTRSPRWARWRSAAGSASTWTARASPMRSPSPAPTRPT